MDFKPIKIVKIALKTLSLTFKVPSEIVLEENITSVNFFRKKKNFEIFFCLKIDLVKPHKNPQKALFSNSSTKNC